MYVPRKTMASAPFGYAQFRILEGSAPDSPRYEFITVNKAFEKITGLKKEKLPGKQYLDLPVIFEKKIDFGLSRAEKDVSLQDSLAEQRYYSQITRQGYSVQFWRSDDSLWNCIFIKDQINTPTQTKYKPEKEQNNTSKNHPKETIDHLNAKISKIKAQNHDKELILDSVSDMITYVDTDLKIRWGNKAAINCIGKNLSDIVDQPCYRVHNIGDSICTGCPLEKSIHSHSTESGTIEREDGRILDINITPIFDEQNNLDGFVETVTDITKDISAKKALLKSEEKYRILTEKVDFVIWEFDILSDKWTHVSPQVKNILGYEPEEWTNLDFWSRNIHPDDRNWAANYCDERTRKGINHSFEYRFRKKDGTFAWIYDDVNVEVVKGKPVRIWGSMKDITRQKTAELALRESEEKLFTTLHSIGDGVITTNTQGLIDAMNPAAEILCGWKLSEIKGKPLTEIFNIINAESRLQVENPVKKVLESGKVIGLENHTILISKNGSERQIADSAAPIKNKEGEMQGVVLVFSDVSDKYAIQKRIIESEEKFRLLITQMEQGLALHEAVYNHEGKMVDYRFIELNDSFEKITGLSRKNILGKTVLEVLPETESYWINKYSKVVETGQSVRYENYSKELDKFFEIIAYRNREHQFATMITDITERKQLEEKIKTSDKIFTHSIDMLCIAGLDGFFKVLNPSWERTLGWSEKELLEKPWIEFVHPEDRQVTTEIKSTLDNGKEVYQFQNRYICKNGLVKWLSWNSFPYPEENIIFGVARDITSQKHSEEILKLSEEKYRLLFEKSPTGIFHYNPEGNISLCNDKFASIMGAPKERILGLDLMKFPDKKFVSIFKESLAGKMATFVGEYTSVSGGITTPLRIATSPIFSVNGTLEGGIAIVEDQTELKKKLELEKKVAVAESSAKFKQQFLANMSHEIRTPLTGILGMADILEQTNLDEQQIDYLLTLKHSGENLKEIINLILDFSKIEAGKIHLRKHVFEFRKLFPLMKNLFQSICKKPVFFETEIDPDIPEFIIADENRILQILNNLLSNAVKFTEKGKISVGAKLMESNTKSLKIKISVTDTGMGVPKKKQKYLFTPFTQLDQSNSRTFEGTGLGLSICKDLTKLHGGDIGMMSNGGEGSTFWFTFKAKHATHNIIEKETKQPKIGCKKLIRVLLAEDKVVNQKVFRIMISSLGHEVTIVNNGQELLEVFEPGLFDIIFMDIQMPVMDGITATQKIKEKYKNAIPIIGLSANAFEGDKEKYMEMGMDEYLMKPVKKEDFFRILDQFFE